MTTETAAETKATKTRKPRATKTPKPEANGASNGKTTRAPRPKKEGLRKQQVAILTCLAKVAKGGSLNRPTIKERIETTSQMGDTLGSVGEDHKDWGFPSLMDLGLVKMKEVKTDSGSERCYEITPSGRKALEKAEKEAS